MSGHSIALYVSFGLALLGLTAAVYGRRIKCKMGKHKFGRKYFCKHCKAPRGHLQLIQGGNKMAANEFKF